MAESVYLFIWGLFSFFWPIILFFLLVPLASQTWLYWRQEHFKHFDNVLFELHMPREVNKGPEAMERLLTALHALRNVAGDLEEVWVDGEVTRPFSIEIASFGGEIHFYLRCYYKSAPLAKAAFFSYYPDIELEPLEVDYVTRLPDNVSEMHAQGYEMYGAELKLKKDGAYPLRNFRDFGSPDEEKQVDPVATLIESLGQVHPEEIVVLQALLTPANPNWHEEHERRKVLEELKESSVGNDGHEKKGASRTWDFSQGPLPVLGVASHEENQNIFRAFMRTPGETDVLKAVEENLSKPAFETVMRFLYFSPKPLFYDSFPRRGVVGSFNQYGAQDLNSFVINYKTATRVKFVLKPYIFPKRRGFLRSERILYNYKHRVVPEESFIGKLISSTPLNWNFVSHPMLLTTQSIAGILHPPTKMVVTTPHMRRVDSRKAGPPAGLAIFGEEEDVERFR